MLVAIAGENESVKESLRRSAEELFGQLTTESSSAIERLAACSTAWTTKRRWYARVSPTVCSPVDEADSMTAVIPTKRTDHPASDEPHDKGAVACGLLMA